MQIPAPPRRAPADSILPMINVVFLLLVFFLITSELRPPDPVAVTPPQAAGEAAPETVPVRLFLDASGRLHGADGPGDAALARLAAASAPPPRVTLRADARTPAPVLARTLRQIADLGITRMDLVVRAP